jgi:adenylate kinase family enzyme
MGTEDDILSSFTDPTKYDPETQYCHQHDRSTFKTLHSHIPLKKIVEDNLTEEFIRSLYVKLPKAGVLLRNIFVIGGPGTGKTTTQRSIGYHIAKNYEDQDVPVQCLECNYLPDALADADPKYDVFVFAVDDPLREQDARHPSKKRALEATNTFLEIRHIIMKKKLYDQVKTFMGVDEIDKKTKTFLDAYHDTPKRLAKKFPEWVVTVSGCIFTIFGPQVPTIDSRLHMSKIWEIYKGFGAMDQQRRADIKRELNKFWIEKLGQNEWRWRGLNQIKFMSKAVIKNTMTEEIGWLDLPKTENVFTTAQKGAKRRQEEVKSETDLIDDWSRWIYENMELLQPPYSPMKKKEQRFRALRNLIRDIYRKNVDPRTYEELEPEQQKFLEMGLKGSQLISSLDDRIIKIHTLQSSDREKIDFIAEQLITEVEKADVSPKTKGATRIIRHIARKSFPQEEGFMDKQGVWKKIYDQFLYSWHQLYPQGRPIGDNEQSGGYEENDDDIPEHLRQREEHERRLVESTMSDENVIEFNITDEDIIEIILERYPEYRTASEIFMHGYGLCGRQQMTNKEMYEMSNTPGQRENYGFREALVSVDAVKYRRKQFSGLYAREMGFLFESWIEEALEKGYELPGVLEDVVEVEHAKREVPGIPDFVFTHSDKSKTVGSIKCYQSDRSETIKKKKFGPEIAKLNDLKEEGEQARLLIIFRNIGIPHLLTYRIYNAPGDVPPNVTFSPSEAGTIQFTKAEEEEDED